jgi:6-phospho-beta-glucosidase
LIQQEAASMQHQFPDGFIWGAATAALQIEGATHEGGRGPSHWDAYRKTHPERFWEGASPDIACDHYHRYREDVTLIKQLGHNGYRLSIAWPRIYPAGTGQLNQEGVDFYSRLFDALVEQGIQPNVTLYHWDLPEPLAQRGGWENKETIDAFVRYCETCFRLFGDRVKMWALMDNFSWLTGYKKRYGFLYVDRATLRRYRKKSSYWYQEVAEKNGF